MSKSTSMKLDDKTLMALDSIMKKTNLPSRTAAIRRAAFMLDRSLDCSNDGTITVKNNKNELDLVFII